MELQYFLLNLHIKATKEDKSIYLEDENPAVIRLNTSLKLAFLAASSNAVVTKKQLNITNRKKLLHLNGVSGQGQ